MTTNVKEAIGLILTGATIMVVAYILLLKQNDIKNDILTFRANEKILSTERQPLERITDKYRSAYNTPDELIPNKVMATLDSLHQKTVVLSISIDKTRDQIKLFDTTAHWLNIILAILLISGIACLSLGVIRYLR